jgi:hypothetical protein
MLKWLRNLQNVRCGMHPNDPEQGPVAISGEHGSEHSGSIKATFL